MRILHLLLLLALIVAFAGNMSASAPTTLHVATQGTDTSSCGSLASPCNTIRYALSMATGATTISLASGTFSGTGNRGLIIDKNDIAIHGIGKELTVIELESQERFAFVGSVSGFSLRDITLRNGYTSKDTDSYSLRSTVSGAGICFQNACSFDTPCDVKSVAFENMTVDATGVSGWGAKGGCLSSEQSFVRIMSSSFKQCDNLSFGGKLGGGLYIKDGHVHTQGKMVRFTCPTHEFLYHFV